MPPVQSIIHPEAAMPEIEIPPVVLEKITELPAVAN
jgi:hypothetical protein